MITIDEFKKSELRVGKILTASRVPDTDKLLQLSVDMGEEKPRDILSGIAGFFPDPAALVGKHYVFVANLEPRTIRGLISNGMILAAKTSEHFSLLEVSQEMAPGTVVG